MNNGLDKEREINKTKNSAFSGVFSILATFVSAVLIPANLLFDNRGMAITYTACLLLVYVVSLVVNKTITKEITKGSKKAELWCEKINYGSVKAGYLGMVVLAFSFAIELLQM